MEALFEQWLIELSEIKNIDISDVTVLINKCIAQVSKDLDIPEYEIRQILNDETYLTNCLIEANCEEKTVKECRDSCLCLYYEPYGCIPRRFPNAKKINKNPDRYIKKKLSKTKDLERFVDIANYLYHNFDGGGLTDNTFDTLMYYLKKRKDRKLRIENKIGAPTVERLRTKLPYFMGSLEKVKPDTKSLENFLNSSRGIVVSAKLDGVSLLIVYKDGQVDKMYTRGDGNIGGDVTFLKDYIKGIELSFDTNNNLNNIVVRGELIIKNKVWNKKVKGLYANARSFVSARVNSGHITPELNLIEFVAYDIIDFQDNQPLPDHLEKFYLLEEYGFQIPYFEFSEDYNESDFSILFKNLRESYEYQVDGLVLTNVDSNSNNDTNQNGSSVAFKMLLEDQIRETKVLNIDWNITRYGKYFPTVEYENVYVDGCRLHRASAGSARKVNENNIGFGTKIVVARSGDVIPQIVKIEIDENIEPIFPIPNKIDYKGRMQYEWYWDGAHIFLDEIEGNRYVEISRLKHFFEIIKIRGLGIAKLEVLHDNGFVTPESILTLDFKTVKIKGIGPATAKKFNKEIKRILNTEKIDRFLIASTVLNAGIGRMTFKNIVRLIPGIYFKTKNEIRDILKKKKIKGIGQKRIEIISKGIPKFMRYLSQFPNYELLIENYISEIDYYKNNYNPVIKDREFVLTGFKTPDYDLEDFIFDNYGIIGKTVTKKTDLVIAKSSADITSKMIYANKLGIPILTIKEFKKKFDL